MGITASRNECQLGLEGHSATARGRGIAIGTEVDFRALCKIEMDRAKLEFHPPSLDQPAAS